MDEAELENLVEPLLRLIRKDKHDKAAKRFVGWINKVGMAGADDFAVNLMGGVALMCVEYDIPASFLDNRVPPISGVPTSALVKATMTAQQLVAQAMDRIKLGGSPVMTAQERELLWATDQHGVLCMYYWLQCIAASWKVEQLPRVVSALYAHDPVEDSVPDSVDG